MSPLYMDSYSAGSCGNADVLQMATLGVASIGLLFSIYSRFSLGRYLVNPVGELTAGVNKLLSQTSLPSSIDEDFATVRLS